MTAEEKNVLSKLVDAWNAFVELPREHRDELTEFRHGVHALQAMVMMRPTRRAMRQEGL